MTNRHADKQVELDVHVCHRRIAPRISADVVERDFCIWCKSWLDWLFLYGVMRKKEMLRQMIKWSVLINGIGLRVVMSEDIDGVYLAAVKEYGCKIEDILAVFCQSPIRSPKAE